VRGPTYPLGRQSVGAENDYLRMREPAIQLRWQLLYTPRAHPAWGSLRNARSSVQGLCRTRRRDLDRVPTPD
jgi:hypothetical protein